MENFIDRQAELTVLEREYASKNASLVVLYGRRRVGKTSLIVEFIKDKPALYFLSTEEPEAVNRRSFQQLAAEFSQNDILRNNEFSRWEDIFSLLLANCHRRLVIAIDEFQYLGKTNEAFPSVFQRIWDQQLSKANVMVILCGSLVSMMVSQVLSYSSPLYGRRTAQINLQPIEFRYFHEFFSPGLGRRELVELYSVTGGVPRYINIFAKSNTPSTYDAILDNILNPSSFLFEEPRFLLQNEVSDIGSYFSILRTIADGHRRLSKIAAVLQQKQTNLPRYLNVLMDLGLLGRDVPITESNPDKSKKGLYFIKDNFLAFWFKFVYPNVSYIETGHIDLVMSKLRQHFIDEYVAFVYEQVCREKMWSLIGEGIWPCHVEKVGHWWDKQGSEIDIVALAPEDKCLIVGECKFWQGAVGVNVLSDLERKVEAIDWEKNDRRIFYVLFSIGGFTDELKQLAASRKNVWLDC